MGTNRKHLNPNLKAWREAEGLTQEQAAALFRISQGHYSRLEQGQMFAGKELGSRISLLAKIPLERVLGIA